MLDIVKRHLAALSSSSWNDYRATLAPDAAHEEMATAMRVIGLDQCQAMAQRWKVAFPDLRATVTRGYAMGDRVIAEVEWSGTQQGPFESGMGMIAPTQKRARVNGVVVFTLRNGKIVESRSYFDLLTVFTQLGVSIRTLGSDRLVPLQVAPL